MLRSRGSSSLILSGLPPARITRVPSSAGFLVPDTGASTTAAPVALARGPGAGRHFGPLPGQGCGSLRAAVVNHQGVTGLENIGGHGTPHNPPPHESHFRFHPVLLRCNK